MSQQPIVGSPVPRADAVEKVTGRAVYAGEIALPGMVDAALVQAAIARGTVERVDTAEAERAPGVIAIFTHENLPPLHPPPETFTRDFPAERRAPLSDNVIHYAGQHLAIVLAETFEQAQQAAWLVRVHYQEQRPTLELRPDLPGAYRPDHFATNTQEKLQAVRGTRGLAAQRIEAEYETPVETHNPMEPSATLAFWEGDQLTLHDSTRWVQGSRKVVSAMLGVSEDRVRVVAPFVGGAFGSKGFLWQHVALTAQAARAVGRPVRLVLTRQQMFTSVGHRPRTKQKLVLGADASGSLTQVEHVTLTETSPVAHFVEPAGMSSRNLYRTPHAVVSHEVAPTNIATPCFMRAPGESPGMFALESAMDELAEAAGIDPLELRLRNDVDRDFTENKPWSSRQLARCYREGAERFGWERRSPAPGSMRRDGKLLGWGMATAAYPGRRSVATVHAVLGRDGVATFSAATHEIGCGVATVMEQIAAAELGLPLDRIRFVPGDSDLSHAPVAGASQTTATVGPAVAAAARQLRKAIVQRAVQDEESPLHGADPALLRIYEGSILYVDTRKAEEVATFASRLPDQGLAIDATAQLTDEAKQRYTFHSFGAHFAEVGFDPGLGELRVTRWVSVMDVGRVINRRTARSQIMGGIVFGLGMALMEQTIYDPRTGAPVNANLSDYLVATSADSPPEIDIHFVEVPDTAFEPLGGRGLGEIGITGVAAAVANAVWHATGIRVRTLPITIDKLLDAPAAIPLRRAA